MYVTNSTTPTTMQFNCILDEAYYVFIRRNKNFNGNIVYCQCCKHVYIYITVYCIIIEKRSLFCKFFINESHERKKK